MLFKKNNSKMLSAVYLGSLLLAFHWYIILYINSSFLTSFVSESKVGLIYTIGSFLNLLFLLFIPKILKRTGNYRFIVFAITAEALSILGLALVDNIYLAIPLFILHQAVVPLILFSLDVFLEKYSPDENTTGGSRGIFLTLGSFALVISPLIASLVLTNGDYWKVYLLSALFLIPLLRLSSVWKNESTDLITNTSILQTFRNLRRNKDLYLIWKSSFVLQVFYAFMVVYLPIYLHEYIGFDWTEIGGILTIMLLPFLLFEIPVGRLADKKFGEKEILSVGFIIGGVATIFLSTLQAPIFWVWALVLFTTRIGASFVEITTESYFFKHVKTSDADLISFFRVARPISFIVAPLITSILLPFLTYSSLFAILGIIMICGVVYSLRITDTR